MKWNFLSWMPIVYDEIFAHSINWFNNFSWGCIQLVDKANALEIERVLFFVDIVKDQSNSITAVRNNFAHHEIFVAFHHLLEFG